jgi:hypothetical protein
MKKKCFYLSWLIAVEASWAVDQSYSRVLKLMEIKSSGSQGTVIEELVPIAVVVGALILLIVGYQKYGRSRATVRQPKRAVHRVDFNEQAREMGFQRAEARLLKKLAERVSPQRAAHLLETETSRDQLVEAVRRRMQRRERELLLLKSIGRKLGMTSEIDERQAERFEAHMPVWILPRLLERRCSQRMGCG